MKFLLALGALCGLATGGAYAQQAPQTQLVTKPGWLYLHPPDIVLDTVAAAGRQNIPTTYTVLDGYRVAMQASGEVFVFRPAENRQDTHAYPGQNMGWPVQLLAYADGRVLFLATTDGYLKARRYQLVELNLATNSCRELAQAKQITAVRYSPDRMRVYFARNGVESTWQRPTN